MIVFSDMDGTLLTSDKQMSDATWAMLAELARRGVEFVPCTGRPLSGIFAPILAHPAVHYAVCANGASVWQLDAGTPIDASRATCILSRPLDRGIAHRIHRIAAGHDVTFDIFADGQCFLPRSLYGRLDEFCGGDPHIAASLKRTRTPIDMDIDSKIDEGETLERIAMYWHDPADRDAIAAADPILLGPGSLYTSIIPNLLVDGVAEAIAASDAQKIYVCNIMTQDGETEGYTAADHLEALQRHGREGIVDLCLANNAPIPHELAARYSEEDAELLRVARERIAALGIALADYPLLSAQGGYARHDPALLAQAVMELYRERTVRIYRGTQQYITEEQEWK